MQDTMRSEIPSWLSREFVKNALEHGKDYSVSIQDLEIDMPVPKGENYVCDIFRAKIKYQKSDVLNEPLENSLIIKVLTKGKNYDAMVKHGIMQKETAIYNEFSKRVNSIFGDHSTDDDRQLLARSYFTTEKDALVLEDLKLKGYRLADRRDQLDLDHSVQALKALAKFHAGSVLVREKEPELIERTIGSDKLFKTGSPIEGFTKASFKLLARALENRVELKKYSKWFEENSENAWDYVIESVKRKDNEINVLNHGDYWVSNFLFKYDDSNKPIGVKPVDFQESRYTSPVVDFIYFFDSSVQEKVKMENFDQLINVYLNDFNGHLERHGSVERLEERTFQRIFKERSRFRLYVVLVVLPFVIADPNSELFDIKETSIDDLGSTEKSPMKYYYKNDKYIKLISKILPEFESLGLITAE